MSRFASGWVLIAVGCLSMLTFAQAQESRHVGRAPTLSERLEMFRQDLLGEGQPKTRRQLPPAAVGADRKFRSGSALNRRPVEQTQPEEELEYELETEVQPRTNLTSGPRPQTQQALPRRPQSSDEQGLVPQAARRAQPTPSMYESENPEDLSAGFEQNPFVGRRPSAAGTARPIIAGPAPPQTPRIARSEKPLAAETRPTEEVVTPSEEFEATEPELEPEPSNVQQVTPAPVVESRKAVPQPAVTRPRGDNVLFSGQSPILTVEALGPRKVSVGKEATFTVKVNNGGQAAASNVVVKLNIPSYAELAGVQASSGTTKAPSNPEHREPFEWRINRLAAQSHETLTVRLVPRKSIPIDLAMQWTCAPETTQTLVEVQEPRLVMSLSGPDEVMYGESRIYKLTLSNPGNGDAENVMVSLLPIGRSSENAVNHKLGILRAGESKAIEVELTARQAGQLVIRAQAFADGGLRADVEEEVLVRRANLQIEVEGPKVKYAGTMSTYRVHVSNTGNATAEQVQLAMVLPPDAKFVAASSGGRLEEDHAKVNWQVGALQPGGERQFELQCTLQAAGDNRLQAIALAEGDVSASAAIGTRVEALADLKLEVRDPQGPVLIGEDAVFEIVVRNRGTKAAQGVDLVVFFSQGVEPISVQGGAHEIGHGQVLFKPIQHLAAGSEMVYRVHGRADRSGNHIIRAELVCKSLGTKLAAEETTHFYGDDGASSPTEPVEAQEPQPTPAQGPQPTPALQPQPTPALEPQPADLEEAAPEMFEPVPAEGVGE